MRNDRSERSERFKDTPAQGITGQTGRRRDSKLDRARGVVERGWTGRCSDVDVGRAFGGCQIKTSQGRVNKEKV